MARLHIRTITKQKAGNRTTGSYYYCDMLSSPNCTRACTAPARFAVKPLARYKKKRYKYVTMIFGREIVWDEPGCFGLELNGVDL